MFRQTSVLLLVVAIMYVEALPSRGNTKYNNKNMNDLYQYGYEIDDNIRGGYRKAWEKRNDGKVVGGYIYDDGHIIRDVLYEADQAGFKVIKDNISPSIKTDTPLNGVASVASFRDGQGVQYVTNE